MKYTHIIAVVSAVNAELASDLMRDLFGSGLWLEAPAAALHLRVDARHGDASDATGEVVSKQLSYDLGAVDWIKIDAGGSPQSTLAQAQSRLKQANTTP